MPSANVVLVHIKASEVVDFKYLASYIAIPIKHIQSMIWHDSALLCVILY